MMKIEDIGVVKIQQDTVTKLFTIETSVGTLVGITGRALVSNAEMRGEFLSQLLIILDVTYYRDHNKWLIEHVSKIKK